MKAICAILWLLCALCASSGSNAEGSDAYLPESVDNSSRRLAAAASSAKCVKWGNTFDVSLTSQNVLRPCRLPDGRPICCSATKPMRADMFAKGVGENYRPVINKQGSKKREGDEGCVLKKQYFSSPQELRDLAIAKTISAISSDHTDPLRLKALVDYVYSEETLRNSSHWLERVRLHMSSEDAPAPHAHDMEYLSRFEYTRECGNVIEKWTEWIEPINIPARHPYSFGACRPVQPFLNKASPRTGRSNVDYVLLQSGKGLFKQNYHDSGRRVNYMDGGVQERKARQPPVKHFLFDSGTSTFDSSLFWFTCGYSQRQVGFDQVYGWEMTLLEPTDYWRRVPPQWKPYWHFFNVPIAADVSDPDSPLRYMQQLAKPTDFVAFKLDIDHPDMEMPIALKLLADAGMAALVDEFFFELHFRCEVMTSCGWGKRVPAESHGLTLDRPQVLEFFMELRKRGIRAHIWP